MSKLAFARMVTLVTKGAPDVDKKWLHIDDNTLIFNRYFKEQDVLNIFQTRAFQLSRALNLSAFHSVVSGVWSESFYKQFEAQCDGVIDFKTEENEGEQENFVRGPIDTRQVLRFPMETPSPERQRRSGA